MKITVGSAMFLACSAAALFVLYWFGFIQPNRPSTSSYPVRGIDVSHHQGKIDWRRATSSPEVQFAFIKASEGARLRDRRLDENWSGAASIPRGAYHFFSFCTDGAAQAQNFLAAAPRESELPPAVDVEFGGNCRSWRSIAQIRIELSEFLSLVGEAHLRKPILYVNRRSFSRIVRGHFDSYSLWVRETVFDPPSDLYGEWRFWQYGVSREGHLPGIETRVDLNVFKGSADELDLLISSRR